MSIVDAVRRKVSGEDDEPKQAPVDVPKGVKEKVERAKKQMRRDAPVRNECLAFWRGDQYVHRNTDGYLVKTGTVLGERPNHRPRTTRNLIHGLVEEKVSNYSQTIPGYEINPTSTDPEDISAAMLSNKIAVYGYHKWGVRRVTRKCVTDAIVMDGGFAAPYWDQTVPPFLDESGVGVGDVRIRTFSGNEVGWEEGVDFEESPWHVIVQGRLVESVMSMPGYIPDKEGKKLTADAQSMEILNSGAGPRDLSQLVMVTEYLERPSAARPFGRRLVIANDRLVLPEENYPCAEYGYDGICLHPLTITVDPENDRDRGLVKHALDAQRTYNEATNKQLAWAMHALNPQIIGPPLATDIKFTDEPGVYIPVVPINGMIPQWRDVPPMPAEFSGMKAEAKQDLYEIFSADSVPDGVESGQGVQEWLQKSRGRGAAFQLDLAAWHSDVMRHCLLICQHFYTEPRLIAIRGRFGWERIEDFKGADINGQADVRVLPGSLEPRTRSQIEARVAWLIQAFPGYVSPEAAMAAIEGGSGEKLMESYELDVARANLILQKILGGPEVFLAAPWTDPAQPPPWAPRSFDNVAVHMHVFADYMKTPDFDQQQPEVQEALRLYYEACEYLKNEADMQAAIQQQQMAEGMGMANAAKTPGPKDIPDVRKP